MRIVIMKTYFSNFSSAPIRVSLFGVGGAGSNVLRALDYSANQEYSVYSVNSDARLLSESSASCKIKLGENLTYGLGAGGDSSLGARMAREGESSFVRAFESCDIAIFIAGLGGGTGSGALPVMAKLAREMGVFLVSVVAMPFEFEGFRRCKQAQDALESISLYSDIVMVFENDWMGTLLQENGLAHEVFEAANRLMVRAVSFIPRLANAPGLLNIGLDDLKASLSGKDNRCLFGYGSGTGDAGEICASVFDSPLLKQGGGIQADADVLVHISGGSGLTFVRVQDIFRELSSRLPGSVQAHVGVAVSEMADEMVEVVLFSSRSGAICSSSLKDEKKERPKVKIITLPIDPVDEIIADEIEDGHDEPDALLTSLDAKGEIPVDLEGDKHLGEQRALDSGFSESVDSIEPPIPPKNQPKIDTLPPVTSGKGRFDGNTPFLIDGEDFDLPPSMRRKR